MEATLSDWCSRYTPLRMQIGPKSHTQTRGLHFYTNENAATAPPRRKRLNLNIISGLQHCTASVEQVLQPVTNLINVDSGGFRWRLALWCGPVRGLNPDGAGWPVGLHRSISRADKSTVICSAEIPCSVATALLIFHS